MILRIKDHGFKFLSYYLMQILLSDKNLSFSLTWTSFLWLQEGFCEMEDETIESQEHVFLSVDESKLPYMKALLTYQQQKYHI